MKKNRLGVIVSIKDMIRIPGARRTVPQLYTSIRRRPRERVLISNHFFPQLQVPSCLKDSQLVS